MRLGGWMHASRVWVLGALAGFVLIMCYFLLPAGFVQSLGYDAVGLGSGAAVLVGLRLHRPQDRASWLMLMAATLCSAGADAVYSVAAVLNVEVPTPSVADVLYLASYPFLFCGLARIGRRSGRRNSRGVVIDAAIVSVGALALSWHLLMAPYAYDDTLSAVGKLTLIAYPIMDIAVLFIVLSTLVLTSVGSVSARLVAAAMAVMLVGDFLYDILLQRGDYVIGGPLDVTWLLNYVLIGVAALHPSMVSLSAHRARRSIGRSVAPLVTCAGLLAVALLIETSVRQDYRDVLPLAVMVALIGALGGSRMHLLLGHLLRQARDLRSHADRLQEALVERDVLAADLRHLAFHDALTGLPNRSLLTDRIGHALQASARTGDDVTLLLCDLDGFKNVNDTLGHHAGDELLKVVAGRLSDVMRPGDTVARLAGDEFGVLASSIHGEDRARAIARRIVDALGERMNVCGCALTVSASVGVAIGTDTSTPDELLKRADSAMYEAKSRGRNRYTIYEAAIGDRIRERSALVNDMADALSRAQFFLEFQPLVAMSDRRVNGYEALVRWQHPVHGRIAPLRFIPLAEDTGLIVPLGKWILRSACAIAAGWPAESGHAPALGVNVSAAQLRDPDFLTYVRAALSDAGLEPQRLVIEITESTAADHPRITDVLRELRALGTRIAIDDFGTGYSSLSQLRHLPADILKIDKSFVDHLGEDQTSAVFVESIVRLARHLGLKTVAEGIERPSQQEALAAIGCDLGQGYLFSPPIAAAALPRAATRERHDEAAARRVKHAVACTQPAT